MQTQPEQTPDDITIERFNKAIDRRPTFAQGYNYRGLAYGNKGEIGRAIQDFNIARYVLNVSEVEVLADLDTDERHIALWALPLREHRP